MPRLARTEGPGRGLLTAAGEPRFVAAAVAVGALTGLAAIALFELIRAVQWVAIGAADVLPSLPAWAVSTVEPSSNAADALDRLSRDGRDALAVVDAEGRLVGVLSLLRLMDVVAREALAGDVVGVSAGSRGAERSSLHLSEDLRLGQIPVGAGWAGRTLRQLEVRARYGVSVIALRRGGVDQGVDPDRRLAARDLLVALGAPRTWLA